MRARLQLGSSISIGFEGEVGCIKREPWVTYPRLSPPPSLKHPTINIGFVTSVLFLRGCKRPSAERRERERERAREREGEGGGGGANGGKCPRGPWSAIQTQVALKMSSASRHGSWVPSTTLRPPILGVCFFLRKKCSGFRVWGLGFGGSCSECGNLGLGDRDS